MAGEKLVPSGFMDQPVLLDESLDVRMRSQIARFFRVKVLTKDKGCERTIREYGYILHIFCRYLRDKHYVNSPDGITVDLFEQFFFDIVYDEEYRRPKMAINRRAYYHTVIYGWIHFMKKADVITHISDNAALRMKEDLRPDVVERHTETDWPNLQNHLRQLEHHIEKLETVRDDNERLRLFRNRAIYMMLWSSAMRIHELLALDRDVIDQELEEFTIIGKKNAQRKVSISPMAIRACKDYLERRVDDHSALFVTHQDNGTPCKRLGRDSVNKFMKKDGKEWGVPKMSPHKVRHLCARRMLKKSNGSLVTVQAYLGHKRISTTEIYARLSDEEKREQIRLLQP